MIYIINSCPLARGGYFLFFIFVFNLGYHPLTGGPLADAGDGNVL